LNVIVYAGDKGQYKRDSCILMTIELSTLFCGIETYIPVKSFIALFICLSTP